VPRRTAKQLRPGEEYFARARRAQAQRMDADARTGRLLQPRPRVSASAGARGRGDQPPLANVDARPFRPGAALESAT
jgi:hypothetical protein